MRLTGLSLSLPILTVLSLLTFSLAGQAAAQAVGFVAGVEGQVEFQRQGRSSWAAALVDRDVELGDVVRTGVASGVKIVLVDETILTLGESTEIIIDSMLVGEAATREPSVIDLIEGSVRVRVGEAFGGPTRLEIHTPTAVIGVKGSEYEAYVVHERGERIWTLVCELDGDIYVRSIDRSLMQIVRPQDGMCSRVFPGAVPEDAVPRPGGFPAVPAVRSPGSPGVASVLFGPPGVGAPGDGGGDALGSWLIPPDPGSDLGGSDTDLGQDHIEDGIQAHLLEGGGFGSGPGSLFPGSGNTPRPSAPPPPLGSGNTPRPGPTPPIGGGSTPR